MANRRNLKKSVNYITSELFLECTFLRMNADEAKKQQLDEIMGKILKMQDEFLSRISHTEPGNVKGFYQKFHADFAAQTNQIIDELAK